MHIALNLGDGILTVMLQSFKYSNLMIRLGLASVFLWFGIDKFLHPDYWLNAWVPASVLALTARIGITGREMIYFNGIFEVLVSVSLISTIFIRLFSVLSVIFILVIMVFHGLNEVLVRDIGLIGGFLALVFWPDRRF